MVDIKKIAEDFKGNTKNIVVPNSKKLTGGFEINIAKYSGLISVIKRRSSAQIAETWSSKIFGNKFSGKKYTARIPAVIARHTYVLETILKNINLKNKKICDFGAGDGQFLKMLKKKKINCELFGIEPSKKNCNLLKKQNIKSFAGTVENYNQKKIKKKFDLITLTWSLCNTSDCMNIIKTAHNLLNKNGYIVVAESSRMLVPFKKPIQMYFGKGNPDIHPFHFSKNSLMNLLLINKFKPVYVNRYIDSDCLLIIARKDVVVNKKKIKIDNYKKVKEFFIRWYNESQKYKEESIIKEKANLFKLINKKPITPSIQEIKENPPSRSAKLMKKKYNQCFDVSEKNKTYLKVSANRSKGILPEMEVTKAHMKILKNHIKKNDKIIDVGCLTGHFYRSFLKRYGNYNLKYTGLDPWDLHISEAKKIWNKDKNTSFKKGWAQKIPFKNNSFDISICCNVITHIPSIENPIKELLRVTRRIVLIRTPIHKISYRIQMVLNSKWFKYTNIDPKDEFDKNGNPRAFEYFDVHSKDYFKSVIKKFNNNLKVKFIKDNFYNKKNINFKKETKKKLIATRVNNEGEQVTDLLIIPNHFVLIKK